MKTIELTTWNWNKYNVKLAHGFRVLNSLPKCWEEIGSTTTAHGHYETGITTIYQSKGTKKYYFVRYFDGCFNKMYAGTLGVDWRTLKDAIKGKDADEREAIVKAFLEGADGEGKY
jgi:hypothetical protein